MAASKEKMHITPDAWTIENLDVFRRGGETYSSTVRRLVENQIASRLEHGDAVFHGMRIPELHDTIDSVREPGETHTEAIIRIIEAYQQAKDVRVGKLTPDLWQKLDGIRVGEEAYVDVIHRLIEEHEAADGLGMFNLWQKLDGIREEDERYADVIHRLIEEHESYTVYLTKSMHGALNEFREDGDTYLSIIERLIKEHKVTEAQQAMTPLGSTKIMRVKPTTCSRIERMARGDEDYDRVVTRLLDERFMYRRIAKDMSGEGQRLLRNQESITNNFKQMIRELVTIDAVAARGDDSIVRQDVDELMEDMLSTPLDEGDSE